MQRSTKSAHRKNLARHASDAAALLKMLANEQRLAILCGLLDGPLSVGQIDERVSSFVRHGAFGRRILR
jgi:DNA-binding transcriptional ArsR family regulator